MDTPYNLHIKQISHAPIKQKKKNSPSFTYPYRKPGGNGNGLQGLWGFPPPWSPPSCPPYMDLGVPGFSTLVGRSGIAGLLFVLGGRRIGELIGPPPPIIGLLGIGEFGGCWCIIGLLGGWFDCCTAGLRGIGELGGWFEKIMGLRGGIGEGGCL